MNKNKIMKKVKVVMLAVFFNIELVSCTINSQLQETNSTIKEKQKIKAKNINLNSCGVEIGFFTILF